MEQDEVGRTPLYSSEWVSTLGGGEEEQEVTPTVTTCAEIQAVWDRLGLEEEDIKWRRGCKGYARVSGKL